MPAWSRQTLQLIRAACEEDLGDAGDITSALLPPTAGEVTGRVVARQTGVVCGLPLGPAICAVFSEHIGRPLRFDPARIGGRARQDGDLVRPGDCLATVSGSQAAVLSVERTLLNFTGRMSGVATLTRRFVEAARQVNPDVKILDTRKTIPGWRELDKYAVRTAGGHNHRAGLYDAVLIKDNHLAGIGPKELADRLAALLDGLSRSPGFVAVEVDNLEQLVEVCKVPGVDVALLDNFTPRQTRTAVQRRDAAGLRGKLALEASGGVTLRNVARIAATGVDRISVGALTHSAPCLDFGLDF